MIEQISLIQAHITDDSIGQLRIETSTTITIITVAGCPIVLNPTRTETRTMQFLVHLIRSVVWINDPIMCP